MPPLYGDPTWTSSLPCGHATLWGTHDGPWGDLAATGRSIEVEHMFFFRVEDDRLVEVWELLDRDALRRQLTES